MSSEPKILSCHRLSPKQPLTQSTLSFSQRLSSRWMSHEMVLFQEASQEVQFKGVTVHTLVHSSFWKNVQALRRLIRTQQTDILHVYARDLYFVCLWAAKQEGCRLIYSPRERREAELAWFWLKHADQIITTTHKDFLYLSEKKKLPNVEHVPDGLDLEYIDYRSKEKTREALCAELHLNSSRFLIGNIGPLIPEEDHLTLLKAFRKLRQKNMDAELCLVGKGPERAKLEQFAEEHGFADRFKIIEEWENSYTLIKAMDIVIYTTFGYDRSDSILLASALRKPVIATKIAQHPEVIVENKTGYLVPCGFPERIDSAVMRLKAISTLALEIGEQGRQMVEKKFSLEFTTRRLQDLYEKISQTDQLAQR